MKLSSQEFEHNECIPPECTFDGENCNPSLCVDNIPSGTRTLALIVDDPDAPGRAWVHWLLYNIPPIRKISRNNCLGIHGKNDFGKLSYGGPCPPSGVHRYFFKLYALDIELPLSEGATKHSLIEAMHGHVLDSAELVGLYKKK